MVRTDVSILGDTINIKFRFHHVGCAVKSIDEAVKYYVGVMGFKIKEETFEYLEQNIRVCFIDMGNDSLLELIEGISEASPVKKILERPGGGVYHACFEVDDLEEAVHYLCCNKFIKYRKKEMNNAKYRALYMITPDDQLLELIQTK